ncbi:MAG: hypothetical protein IJ274_12510 [Lachnospiraceae bacterium]|nr:hypothetical protein [Lachnospiraceae bacterium]
MQLDANKFDFLVGNFDVLQEMSTVPVLPMFSDEAMEFLSALSRNLLNNKRAKSFVDVMSYAYWIRKASLEAAKEKHMDYNKRLGRGVAFHIAPSNVPVNFAVSMTSSILAGNCTLIRLSQKEFEQVDIICEAMNELLENEFQKMKAYFCLFRYEHDEVVTQELSSMCDVRIIWGGDKTIATIRKASLPPRAIELAFADRHSLAVINSDEYLNCNSDEVARGFYTDTYYTDQNACSSPRIVIWTGNSVAEAKERFWTTLENLVRKNYEMKPIQAVDKYTSFCILAMEQEDVQIVSKRNEIMRVEVKTLDSTLMEYKQGGGYFFEYTAKTLEEIIPILSKSCQTISYLGEDKEKIKQLVFDAGIRGVDRIVPVGQTMGLEFVWDGYKMIEAMSRIVYVGG